MIKILVITTFILVTIKGFSLANPFDDDVVCKDLDPDCPSRKIFCDHEAYRAVMILKCAKTCDACDEVNKMIEEMEIEEDENDNKQLPWTHGGSSAEKEVDVESSTEKEIVNEETETTVKEEEEEEDEEESSNNNEENVEESESTTIESVAEEENSIDEEPMKVIEEEEEEMAPELSIEEDNKNEEIAPEDITLEVPTNSRNSFKSFNKYKGASVKPLNKMSKLTTPPRIIKITTKKPNIIEERIKYEKKKRCIDDASDCEVRKNLCDDVKFGSIVKKVCKRTCGVCQVETIPSNTYKPLAMKSRNTKKGNDFYYKWKESRNTTPKPVIITMQHMKNQTKGRNTYGRKTITKKVTQSPRSKNPYVNLLSGSGRYGSRGADTDTDTTTTTTTVVDKAIDCVAKQALCNHKSYKNLMEKMCPKTCASTFQYFSYNK
uniref:ShKT domain-containing protein n=1 Tax=Parastrongyloides trichosuri TaxID=131310 RepID=A0A0N4ZM21_PARTI